MKGKNFSLNNVSGKRKKSDLYETPFSMTKQLIEKEYNIFENSFIIWEPACGNKAISKIIENEFPQKNIKTSDINDKYKTDFLNFVNKFNIYYDLIITNPPYSLSEQFILKAKQLSKKYIVMLLPLSYLHGQNRYEKIWNDKKFPLKKTIVFTRYPLLGEKLRKDGKYNTGMQVYAWYIWEKGYKGKPSIDWINNNEYVLKKGER